MADNPVVIEPLDVSRRDRLAFTSGVNQVDNFFWKSANKHARAGNLRVFVMSAEEDLIGLYAINALSIDGDALPQRFTRSRPVNGSFPGAMISMIGVDARFQGQGYGGLLLSDALKRIYRLATELGIAVVVLDVLDCGDVEKTVRRKQLYLRYSFQELQDDPSRLFLPVAIIERLADQL